VAEDAVSRGDPVWQRSRALAVALSSGWNRSFGSSYGLPLVFGLPNKLSTATGADEGMWWAGKSLWGPLK